MPSEAENATLTGLTASADNATPDRVTVASDRLFDGADMVLIEHEGATYRLRKTRLGKLILTK
jgi:hemin uptake protein HemP